MVKRQADLAWERKAVSNRVKKFEETAHEIHDMADRHHTRRWRE